MTKWNNETQRWEDDYAMPSANSEATPSTAAQNVSAFEATTAQEPTTEEHASMIRKATEWLARRAVEASGLEQRVKEMEDRITQMQRDLMETNERLYSEQAAHAETTRQLQQVQTTLAQRESTVHDLVMERDIAIDERDTAQRERDDARSDAKFKQENIDFLAKSLREVEEANKVLHKRNDMLSARIGTLRSAFAALNDTV